MNIPQIENIIPILVPSKPSPIDGFDTAQSGKVSTNRISENARRAYAKAEAIAGKPISLF